MTRSERRVFGFVAALVLLPSLPSLAFGQETSSDPLVPFEEGRVLVRSGRYAEAVAKFEESYKIKATSGAMLNLADCYEKLGRYASAATAFERAAKLAEENGQADRAKEANDRRSAVEPSISHLTVRAPSDSNVTVDGAPLVIGAAVPVDGGEHFVRMTMPCRIPKEERISIGLRAEEKTVSFEPGPRSEDQACGGPPPMMNVVSPATEAPSSWSSHKTVAVVMGGASLVALGAGIGFGLSASAKKDDLDGACRDYPNGCPIDRREELETTYDDASRAAAYSTLGIIAGVVFLGAAVGLYLTAPKNPSRIARSALRVEF